MTEKEQQLGANLRDQVIHKYRFPITDEFELELPKYHRILKACVQPSTGDPTMWVSYHEHDPKETINFRLVGTGHTHKGHDHIDTFFQGPFVWHLFYGIRTL